MLAARGRRSCGRCGVGCPWRFGRRRSGSHLRLGSLSEQCVQRLLQGTEAPSAPPEPPPRLRLCHAEARATSFKRVFLPGSLLVQEPGWPGNPRTHRLRSWPSVLNGPAFDATPMNTASGQAFPLFACLSASPKNSAPTSASHLTGLTVHADPLSSPKRLKLIGEDRGIAEISPGAVQPGGA